MSDSEDDLIAYGTPLEPLEEDEIPNKKPRLVEDQMVKDKQGRRRFHGAFTGGFSAGFFNTVGSLEGWAPSSFKSSKSKKQEIFQQKPEDFMDEEDVSEFGIAPVVLKARQDYTNEKKMENPFSEFVTIGSYILQDVLKHVRETVGIKLLKKMGWKPGQGVGPRLSRNEKKNSLKIRQKTYGCQLPPGSFKDKETDTDSDSNSDWDDIQFAPSDYEAFLCEAKNNFCGLGYEGLDKRPVLSGNSSMKREEVNKKRNGNKNLGFGTQAFGVGAFEEEDEDIYAKDDMSRYNFSLGADEPTDANKSADKNSLTSDDIIEGFVLETKTFVRKHYPLPTIPKDLKPRHKLRRTRFDQPCEKTVKGFKDNHENRRKLIGETSSEMLDMKKREEQSTKQLISNVEIQGNKFKPFSVNPEKQERYENYLKLIKIGKKELLAHLQPLSMTDWDKEREKLEFEKAAALFRPLSGGMEDRFSTASQPDDLSDPLAVVEKFCDENDDRRKAAKMKMFGPVTRRKEDWIPDPLLCKRFNIPDPQKSHVVQSLDKQKKKPSFDLFNTIHQNLEEKVENIVEKIVDVSSTEKPSEAESNKPEAKKENITDLYKAIFLASDDEEESEGEKREDEQSSSEIRGRKVALESDILFEEKLINSKRNSSPPKGLFENIDLELLSRSKKKDASVPEATLKMDEEQKESAETNVLSLNLAYGPQIPVKLAKKSGFFASEPSSEDVGVWVEKKSHSGKKHKKKDKKSKKASHKSKHKHKHKR